jgi:hypothetical protein
MKVLESQAALLSNYEVYAHLMEQRARYNRAGKKRRGPPNLETVVREVQCSPYTLELLQPRD